MVHAVQTSEEKQGGACPGEMELGSRSCNSSAVQSFLFTAIKYGKMVKSSMTYIGHATSKKSVHVQDSDFKFLFVFQEQCDFCYKTDLSKIMEGKLDGSGQRVLIKG